MPIKKPPIIIYLLISLLLIAASAGAISWYSQEEEISFTTVPVSRMDLEETVLASGTLHAFKTVEVGAQVSGQLKTLHVALGDQVKTGDQLAEIDPVLQQNALKEAEAEQENMQAKISASQALLKQYQQDYQRKKHMLERDATSRSEFESVEAQYATAKADLAALKAQLKKAVIAVDTARANLGYTRISAPMDGMVIELDADEGQTLVSSQTASTILTLADMDRMTIKAEISEADVTRAVPGQTVYFTILGEPDKRHYGRLRAVEPGPVDSSSSSTSGNAVYYNGLFDVENSDHRLRVGMTAEVTIVLAQVKQALSVPVSALRNANSKKDVQIEVLENGRPVSRTVRLGLNDRVNVQILDGVKEGEQLIRQTTEVETTSTTRGGGAFPPPPRGN